MDEADMRSTPTGPSLCDGDWQHRVLETLGNLVCLCHDERVVYINPAGVRTLGKAGADELIGRQFSEFVVPDYRAHMDEAGLEAFAEEPGGIPMKLLCGDKRAEIDVHLFVNVIGAPNDGLFMIEARDVTDFIRAAEATHLREQRLRGILNAVADGIMTLDSSGAIRTANPAAEALFGSSLADLQGMNFGNLIYMGDRHSGATAAGDPAFRPFRPWDDGETGRRELIGRCADGSRFHMELTCSELKEGGQDFYTLVFRDVSQRKQAEDRIRHLAHHDALTGLPNRVLFRDRLENAILRASRNDSLVALLFIDLDNFKPINDDLGHDAGDAVLKHVAKRISRLLRATDTVARIGGDEFVVVLEGLHEAAEARRAAKKMVTSMAKPFDVALGTCSISASIGIAVYPLDADSPDTLIKCADDAMYRIKNRGRNGFAFFGE